MRFVAVERMRGPLVNGPVLKFLFVICLTTISLRITAQAQNPEGSYQQTCRDIRVAGSTLNASCKNGAGHWTVTSLNEISTCIGDIANYDGALACNKGSAPPAGSYANTCRYVYMNGATLNATCKNRDRKWSAASLDAISACIGDIANHDGALACNKGSAPPEGSYANTCRYVYMTDMVLNATCENENRKWVATSLHEISRCIGDIANYNGALACSKGSTPPKGSYTNTCRYIYMTGMMLSATCKNRDRKWVATSLHEISKCIGDIANYDGTLRCSTGTAPPGGSYTQTCRDIFEDGSILYANCKSMNKKWTTSWLVDCGACSGDVWNADSHLACVKGTGGDPKGSYRNTCWDVFVNGNSVTAQCEGLHGKVWPTTLDGFDTCRSGIYNFDGTLSCNRGTGDPPPGSYLKMCKDIVVEGHSIRAKCLAENGTLVDTSLFTTEGCSDISDKNGVLTCEGAPPPANPYTVDLFPSFAPDSPNRTLYYVGTSLITTTTLGIPPSPRVHIKNVRNVSNYAFRLKYSGHDLTGQESLLNGGGVVWLNLSEATSAFNGLDANTNWEALGPESGSFVNQNISLKLEITWEPDLMK